MNSWLVWMGFAAVAAMLGAVGYHFSLRTLRWVALSVTLATAVYLTVYGLTHPAYTRQLCPTRSPVPTRSAAADPSAVSGHRVPVPGRIGWVVIVVLLVLGYRAPARGAAPPGTCLICRS
jgi:hypothetical protein